AHLRGGAGVGARVEPGPMDLERAPKSALARKLKEASRAHPRTMGFAREHREEKPPRAMVLLVEVDGLDAKAAKAAVGAGADAIAFSLNGGSADALGRGELSDIKGALKACGSAIPGLAFAEGVSPALELFDGTGELG